MVRIPAPLTPGTANYIRPASANTPSNVPNPSANTNHFPDGFQPRTNGVRAPIALADRNALVMGILSKYEYGPKGLETAAPELAANDIKCQIDSSGHYRGRLFFDDGFTVDVCAKNERDNWWTAKTGSQWGWTERGINPGVAAGDATAFVSDEPLSADPLGLNDPLMRAQKNLAKSLQREKDENEEQLMRDQVERGRLEHIDV